MVANDSSDLERRATTPKRRGQEQEPEVEVKLHLKITIDCYGEAMNLEQGDEMFAEGGQHPTAVDREPQEMTKPPSAYTLEIHRKSEGRHELELFSWDKGKLQGRGSPQVIKWPRHGVDYTGSDFKEVDEVITENFETMETCARQAMESGSFVQGST
jgi:hypothetical protein